MHKFDPVTTAKALKELNALNRADGISAALAYLSGELPDMREIFDAIWYYQTDTGADAAHDDAVGYVEDIVAAAIDYRNVCTDYADEMTSGDPFDYKCDAAREDA